MKYKLIFLSLLVGTVIYSQTGTVTVNPNTFVTQPAAGTWTMQGASNFFITRGIGTPEGTVIATPGSLYLDRNGKLWFKITGSSNTGWVQASNVPTATPTATATATSTPTATATATSTATATFTPTSTATFTPTPTATATSTATATATATATPTPTPTATATPDVNNTTFGAALNGITTRALSQDRLYAWGHIFDTNDNGKVNVLDLTAGIPKTNSSGVLSVATVDVDYTTPTGVETLTNKRITPRITTIISSGTPTINTDSCDAVTITALAATITSMTTNLSGTPSNFDKLIIRFKDNGSARGITWGASFVSSQATLPTTTVSGKVTTVGLQWDSVKAKWVCLATDQEP